MRRELKRGGGGGERRGDGTGKPLEPVVSEWISDLVPVQVRGHRESFVCEINSAPLPAKAEGLRAWPPVCAYSGPAERSSQRHKYTHKHKYRNTCGCAQTHTHHPHSHKHTALHTVLINSRHILIYWLDSSLLACHSN